MEKWPDVLGAYPSDPGHKDFGKVLLDAETVLSGDLAPFEAEYLIQTLLFEPINILNALSTKHFDEIWSKPLTDSFKIISKLIEKYEDVIIKYNNDIVERCTSQYIDIQTRKEALNCLKFLVKSPAASLDRDVAVRYIDMLEEASNLKAPLALLVGSMCRHRPELIGEELTRIWRVYLIMLQARTKTDNVANAILEGIDGLLVHFGGDIPMDQLDVLYQGLSTSYIAVYTEASLSLLNHHAYLFKERLAGDKNLRSYLWNVNSRHIIDTLWSIYKVIFDDLDCNSVETMIKSEIEPKLNSWIFSVKNAATKIIIYAKMSKGLTFSVLNNHLDLEYLLMSKKLSYEEGESVHWSIETNIGDQHSQDLLITAIKYIDNIPTNRRIGIIVNGVYKANDDVRKAALVVLIKLSLHYTDKYINLWRSLLDNVKGSNVQKSIVVFRDSVLAIMGMVNDGNMDITKIKPIICLLVTVLSLHKQEMDSKEFCTALASNLRYICTCMNTCVWELIGSDENQNYFVEQFQDDTVLSLLYSLLDAADERKYTLNTLKVLFSKYNTDPKMLYHGVMKLDNLIKSTDVLDILDVSLMTDKLKTLQNRSSHNKDDRILQREIIVFLSKYRHLGSQENFNDNVYLLRLKNKINLNLEADGVTYKIDLQRILQICLRCEHLDAVYALLVIFSANLGSNLSILEDIQEATVRLIYATFKSQSRSFEVDVVPALVMCNTSKCVQLFMSFMNEERNVGVKEMLSKALEVLLVIDPQRGEEMTQIMAERGMIMIQSDNESTQQSGFYIIKSFVPILKQNDDLTKELLPKLIVLLQTSKSAILESLSNIYLEKLDIFNIKDIEELIENILYNYVNKVENPLTEVVEKSMNFIKIICERNKYEILKLFNYVSNNFIKENKRFNVLNILAVIKMVFGEEIIIEKNIFDFVVDGLKDDLNDYEIECILLFLVQYAKEVFDYKSEEIITYIGKILESMAPKTVLQLKDIIAECINKFQVLHPNTIQILKPHLHVYCQKIDINAITTHLQEMTEFDDSYSEIILSLRFLSEILNENISDTENWTDIIVNNRQSDVYCRFLSDILTLSEKCMTNDKFEYFLINNNDFVKRYLNVYFQRVLYCKPELIDKALLLELLDVFVNKLKSEEEYLTKLMDLVEMLWPSFQSSDFDMKIALVTKLFSINNINSSPCKWGLDVILSKEYNLEQKIKLIKVLPPGEDMSIYYAAVLSLVATRLSELRGDHCRTFKALLDTLARNCDATLFDMIATFAAGDDTKGWWDHAFDECMATIAINNNIDIITRAEQRASTSLNSGICKRILMPLLRHSSTKTIESFILNNIPTILTTLSRGCTSASNTDVYLKVLNNYAKNFCVLHIAFDKLPQKSLEFGEINAKSGNPKPWYFTEEICKHCINLTSKVKLPSEPTDAIKKAYIWFQSSAYNCLVSAICKRKPKKKVYAHVLNLQLWAKIVDEDEVYDFELKAYNEKKKPSIANEESSSSSNLTLTRTRTRLFLKTLSEDPLKFDMLPQEEDHQTEQEDDSPQTEDGILNKEGSVTSLSYLLEHCMSVEHSECIQVLISALITDLRPHAKCLVAKAIYNTQELLKPYSGELGAAILNFVVSTSKSIEDRHVLNNLHVLMLETIISWESQISDTTHLDTTIANLISTLLLNNKRYNIFRRLLNVLNKLLELYGKIVKIQWDVFKGHEDLTKSSKYLIPILEKILKNSTKIPEILPNIFGKLDSKQWVGKYKIAELFGMALEQANSVDRDEYLEKFKNILKNLKNGNIGDFVKVLFYAQKNCWKCCDMQMFRIITDLAPKIEKSKCLSIIGIHLEHSTYDEFYIDMVQTIDLLDIIQSDLRREGMRVAQNCPKFVDSELKELLLKAVVLNCRSSSAGVRGEAYKFVLKAFQDLFKTDRHSIKRRALDSSPLIDKIETSNDYEKTILQEISTGMFDKDGDICNLVCEGVSNSLSKDMDMRFAELFHLTINLSTNNFDMCTNGSRLLQLLFKHLRERDSFNNVKLRDEALNSSLQDINIENLTSGIFNNNGTEKNKRETRQIDVQTPVVKLFDTFLEMSKTNTQVCQELCLQIMRCLKATSRRFDFRANLSKQLAFLLAREPNPVTPFVLEAARMFLDTESAQRFETPVGELKQSVYGTDGYKYVNLLYEDILLRNTGRSLFEFSFNAFTEHDEPMSQEFDLEDFTSVFGQLSNWDDLTIQDKKRLEYSLPALWTTVDEFDSCVRTYYESRRSVESKPNTFWFDKMVESCLSSSYLNKVEWLKISAQWPRRPFAIDAILETMEGSEDIKTEIKSTDCLAEWAGRLMLRNLIPSDLTSSEDSTTRSVSTDELHWCQLANARDLPLCVLTCVERNTPNFTDSDVLPWLEQKIIARRAIAVRQHDLNVLSKILEVAEEQMQIFGNKSTMNIESNISMQVIILQLRNDLKLLNHNNIEVIMNAISNTYENKSSSNTKKALKTAYNMALLFYNKLWDDNDLPPNEILTRIIMIMEKIIDSNIQYDVNLLFSIILNKMSTFDDVLDVDTARKFVNIVTKVRHLFDSFTTSKLIELKHIFPLTFDEIGTDRQTNICMDYFACICDPNHLLAMYCKTMKLAKDEQEFQETYKRMKDKFFNNQHGGTDFEALNTIKMKLVDLHTKEKDEVHRILNSILTELKSKDTRSQLRLNQISPNLCSNSILDTYKEDIRKLLCLPPNVYVVKFLNQVSVYTDSIRRPCLITALLSTGISKKYLLKCGETLLLDSSVLRCVNIFKQAVHNITSYNVIPTSEDSAIIEYLDDHIRVRDLVADKIDINAVLGNAIESEDTLILSVSRALQQYKNITKNIDPYTLRSAIEDRCASVEEFLTKKLNFMNSLSTMTIITWLFGLGDRHLENIMYCLRSGSLCAVDLASAGQYGARELPPARLTTNFVAVCDAKVLEARLQQILSTLRERDSAQLYLQFITSTFHWKKDFQLQHITNILQGTATSIDITKSVIETSDKTNKNAYINLLQQVSEDIPIKDTYSVEEQISCLLLHCTNPKILSVCPRTWEPWV